MAPPVGGVSLPTVIRATCGKLVRAQGPRHCSYRDDTPWRTPVGAVSTQAMILYPFDPRWATDSAREFTE
jgi:hypothetical protein